MRDILTDLGKHIERHSWEQFHVKVIGALLWCKLTCTQQSIATSSICYQTWFANVSMQAFSRAENKTDNNADCLPC